MSDRIAAPTPLGIGVGAAPFLGVVDVPLTAIRECVHDSAQLSVR